MFIKVLNMKSEGSQVWRAFHSFSDECSWRCPITA